MSAQAVAGETAKLLAARLEGHGYRVMFPPGPGPAVLKVIGLEGRPYAEVTDLATALLTGRTRSRPRLGRGYQRENITFKGIVGLELKARGLGVDLTVYCDETVFDTFTEIIATALGPEDGQVCVTGDGGLTWTRDCQAGPAAVAGSVVEAVTRAVSCLRAAGTGEAGHG